MPAPHPARPGRPRLLPSALVVLVTIVVGVAVNWLVSPTLRDNQDQPAARAPAPSATFVPVLVEAEDPANALLGGPTVIACTPCGGGARVGHLDPGRRLVMRFHVSVAGTRTIRVTYENDSGPRQLTIRLDDIVVDVRTLTGTGWEDRHAFVFTTAVPAGLVELTLFNDTTPAPDIDRVSIEDS